MASPPPTAAAERLRHLPFATHFRAYAKLDKVMRFYESSQRGRWLLFAANYPRSRQCYYLLVPRTDAALQTLLRHVYSSVPHRPNMLHEVIGPRTHAYDPWPRKIKVDYDGAEPHALDAIKASAVRLWGPRAHYVCVEQADGRPSFHATFYRVCAVGMCAWRRALQRLADDLRRTGDGVVAAKVDTAAGAKKTMRCLFSAKADGTQYLRCVQCAPLPSYEVSHLQQFKYSLATYFDDSFYGSLKIMTNTARSATRSRRPPARRGAAFAAASLYPAVAAYLATRSGGRAKIRKVVPCGRNLWKYYTTNWRYCENIGREHQSNNVYFVVDVRRKKIFQRCLDDECTAFCGKKNKLLK